MSGDGAGLILGAAVALPVVAVAGAGLVAYGAAKAIVAIGKSAFDMYQAHEKQVQLQLTSTNTNIDNFYASLDAILAQQNHNTANAIKEAQASIAAATRDIENIQADPSHVEQWHQEVTALSNQVYNQLHQAISTAAETNRIDAQQKIAAAKATLDSQMKLQFDMEQTLLKEDADKTALHNTVEMLLKQSRAALEQLTARDTYKLVQGELEAYRTSYQTAKKSHDMWADEGALSSAQTLLRETAALASVLAQREEARWQALFGAHLVLSNVRSRLLETETLTFTNPHTKKCQTLYLDDFVSGRLEELLDLTEGKLHQLELAMGLAVPTAGETIPVISNAEADLLYQQVELTVMPELELLQTEATEQIAAYLDRLHCLDVIAEELQACSSYKLQWTATESADPTAPINMQLYNNLTGDQVTITISSNDDGSMNLDTHSFNAYGSVNHENYRQQFYNLVVNSLRKADPNVAASLACCKGTENRNSTQTQYQNMAAVQNIPSQDVPQLASRQILE